MILGALLAAGTASRFEGANKLLAILDGEPVVARAARTLTESSLDGLVAIAGHDRERVAATLPDRIEVLDNPEYEQGQSSSIRRAVEAARERDADAVLFALGDMPRVRVETVEKLCSAYREGAGEIVAPRYDGCRGNPVLFDSRYFDALARVEGDAGGRELLESESVAWVAVEDPGIHRDVDTVADLRELREESADRQNDSANSQGESAGDSGRG